jgi:hypothetical protein
MPPPTEDAAGIVGSSGRTSRVSQRYAIRLIRSLGLEFVDARKVRGARLSPESGDAHGPDGS